MAPEIILKKGHDTRADWWALGIFMYELATGEPPYMEIKSPNKLAYAICTKGYKLPNYFTRDFSDLLQRLTDKSPNKRIGSKGGSAEIKAHPFFSSITNWDDVARRGLTPPIVPDNFVEKFKSKSGKF